MFKIINVLFESYGFLAKEVGNAKFYSMNETNNKMSFWLVIQEANLDSLLDKQLTLFSDCKKVCQHSSLEKNLSMLVLWDTGGNLDLKTMKRKVMALEEDPYFFKKYVLYSSSSERHGLNEVVGDQDIHEFIKSKIASQEIFSQYKENPISQNWQSLLYRIAIKTPFVEIDIEPSEGLNSLFENNKEKIEAAKDKTLVAFDQLLYNKFKSRTSDNIKEIDAKAILSELLIMQLGGETDGDKN